MKDEKFKEFMKEHIDHDKFSLGTNMMSTGYGMDEHDEARIYARCDHDGVIIKRWLKE